MKTVLIFAALLLALAVVAGLWFWYSVGSPLYRPGMVRSGENLRAPLEPPEQTGVGTAWRVEKDIELHRYSHGAGRRVLVIHGGPGVPIRQPWSGLEPLASDFEFVYYDQRGCGRSTRPIDRFSSSNYYANMKALEQTLGLGAQLADIERIRRIIGEEKLLIIGHSFGGFLASMYAAEFPARVEALILVAPADVVVLPAEDGGLFEDVRRRLPEDMKDEYADFLDDYFDFGAAFSKSEHELAALNRELTKYYSIASGTEHVPIPEEDGTIANGGWMVTAMYFSMGKRHDYRAALAGVEAPVLIIHGEKDLQPERASRAYGEYFGNASVHIIRGAGHFSFDERPEEFAEVVGRFLNERR